MLRKSGPAGGHDFCADQKTVAPGVKNGQDQGYEMPLITMAGKSKQSCKKEMFLQLTNVVCSQCTQTTDTINSYHVYHM